MSKEGVPLNLFSARRRKVRLMSSPNSVGIDPASADEDVFKASVSRIPNEQSGARRSVVVAQTKVRRCCNRYSRTRNGHVEKCTFATDLLDGSLIDPAQQQRVCHVLSRLLAKCTPRNLGNWTPTSECANVRGAWFAAPNRRPPKRVAK
jgi:hypothetical protein